LQDIAEKYGYEIIEMEIMLDYLHLFVATKPTVAAIDVIRTLKSLSAIKLSQNIFLKKSFMLDAVLSGARAILLVPSEK
jgi:putative transposase